MPNKDSTKHNATQFPPRGHYHSGCPIFDVDNWNCHVYWLSWCSFIFTDDDSFSMKLLFLLEKYLEMYEVFGIGWTSLTNGENQYCNVQWCNNPNNYPRSCIEVDTPGFLITSRIFFVHPQEFCFRVTFFTRRPASILGVSVTNTGNTSPTVKKISVRNLFASYQDFKL